MTQLLKITAVVILFGLTLGMAQLYQQSISPSPDNRAAPNDGENTKSTAPIASSAAETESRRSFSAAADTDGYQEIAATNAPMGDQAIVETATIEVSNDGVPTDLGTGNNGIAPRDPDAEVGIKREAQDEISDTVNDFSENQFSGSAVSYSNDGSDPQTPGGQVQTFARLPEVIPSLKSDPSASQRDMGIRPSLKIPPRPPRQKPYGTSLPPSPNVPGSQTGDE